MYSVEFLTTVENGTISIPPEHRDRLGKHVKVILLSEELGDVSTSHEPGDATLIDRLLDEPLHYKHFRPLTRDDVYGRE